MGEWVAAFVQRLRELGWIEGRNIAIEYQWAEARSERYGEIAAELVQSKVDVIVTTAPAFPAVQQATSVIPIVFALAPADPVAAGFIASLARPGGNATGLSMLSPDTAGKRLELLREIVPGIRRLAVMVNLGFPGAVQEGSEAHAAASALGLEVVKLEIRRPQISRQALSHSRRMRFMSRPTRSLTPIGLVSIHLPSALDCRRFTRFGNPSRREA